MSRSCELALNSPLVMPFKNGKKVILCTGFYMVLLPKLNQFGLLKLSTKTLVTLALLMDVHALLDAHLLSFTFLDLIFTTICPILYFQST